MAKLSSPIGPTIDVAAQVISRTVIGGGGGRGRGGAIVPVSRAIEPGALVAPPAPPAVTTQDVGFLQKQINALVKRDQEQIVANNNLVSAIQKQFDVIKVAVTDLGSNLNVVGKLLNSDAQLEQNQAKQEAIEQKKASEAEYRKGAENALEQKIIGALMAPVKAIGDRLQFTLANLMKFFGILFTGWLVDKVINLFKANAEGNKQKFNDIKNAIIKNLLIAGGVLTILNLGFLRIVGTITNLAFKLGKFVIGNTIGRLFGGIAALARKLGSAVAGMVGLGGATKPTTTVAGGASRVTMGAGTAEEIAKAEGKSGNWLTKLFGGGAAAETKAASTAAKGGAAAAGKTAGRFIPGVNVAVSGTLAAVDFSQGDILGGALNTVGMVPGPIGWVGSLGRLGLEGMRMMGSGKTNTPPTTPTTPTTSTTPAKPATPTTSTTSAKPTAPISSPQSPAIPPVSVTPQSTQTPQQSTPNQSSPQQTMVPAITGAPPAEPTGTPTISTPSESKVPELPSITPLSTPAATSTPQTAPLPPPSPEMVKKFEMAWQYRNNPLARGRIVEAWNNMTPQQQQQAITWAKSKGYDWTEMKLTPKPVPATTSQPAQVQAPTSQTSGAQIETPQPAKIDTLPVPPVVGAAPAPKPNVIYASSNTNQKQPQAPLKSGTASEVPFIASSNPDNFYLLYSQVQYNVVI